jgi:hypothetical protein
MLQEKMSVQFMPLNMRTAWFELRVTLCEVVSYRTGVKGCMPRWEGGKLTGIMKLMSDAAMVSTSRYGWAKAWHCRIRFHKVVWGTGNLCVNVMPSKPFNRCRSAASLGRTLHSQQLAALHLRAASTRQDASTAVIGILTMHGADAELPANTYNCVALLTACRL